MSRLTQAPLQFVPENAAVEFDDAAASFGSMRPRGHADKARAVITGSSISKNIYSLETVVEVEPGALRLSCGEKQMSRFGYSLVILLLWLNGAAAQNDKAIFAGGCFWCMEAAFQELDGVKDVISGFTGGTLKNPTYDGNHSGHYEAIEVTYDPAAITYENLLQVFWRNIDPFDENGQFCDKGFSYQSAIFVADASQKQLAEASKQDVIGKFPDGKVVTPILDARTFYPVKEYHQDYYLKNPLRYKYYRWGCGRDRRLKELWGEAAGH